MNSLIWPFFNCLFLIIKLICIFLLFHANSTLFETSKWQLNRIFKLALINDALKNLVTFKAKLALLLFFPNSKPVPVPVPVRYMFPVPLPLHMA
jgi:hypothetical protein